jgi:hypothetical protein
MNFMAVQAVGRHIGSHLVPACARNGRALSAVDGTIAARAVTSRLDIRLPQFTLRLGRALLTIRARRPISIARCRQARCRQAETNGKGLGKRMRAG